MRVHLIHWNQTEARERAEWLAVAGHTVNCELPAGQALFWLLADSLPDAIVIDLSRLPSQGRDVGITIRTRARTRRIPLVFVGGNPDKVAAAQKMLPDAVFTSWAAISGALSAALANPPSDPVVPASAMAAYEGRALPDKLGLRAGMTVGLVGAPATLRERLAQLAQGVTLKTEGESPGDLTLWFVHTAEDLKAGMPRMVALAAEAPLWIAWRKRASGVASDVNQAVVREKGLAAGLVDYKICSIDDTWSALLFARRRSGTMGGKRTGNRSRRAP